MCVPTMESGGKPNCHSVTRSSHGWVCRYRS